MSLSVVNLNFEYENYEFDCTDKKLLNNVNFNLSKSSALHLQGKNGSGKTTALKIIAGIIYPDQGEILYNNQSIYKNIISYHADVCYLGHKNGISLSLTVLENCQFDLRYTDLDIDDVLKKFNLFEFKNSPCYLLSSGLRRRVGLLRIVLSKSKLLLLDEPIVALDKEAIAAFIAILKEHILSGGMVIYTSHQKIDMQISNHYEYTL